MYYIQQSKNIYLKGLQKLCSFFLSFISKVYYYYYFCACFRSPRHTTTTTATKIRKEIICFQCSFPAAAVTPIKWSRLGIQSIFYEKFLWEFFFLYFLLLLVFCLIENRMISGEDGGCKLCFLQLFFYSFFVIQWEINNLKQFNKFKSFSMNEYCLIN